MKHINDQQVVNVWEIHNPLQHHLLEEQGIKHPTPL
jgi:hypothetical protein